MVALGGFKRQGKKERRTGKKVPSWESLCQKVLARNSWWESWWGKEAFKKDPQPDYPTKKMARNKVTVMHKKEIKIFNSSPEKCIIPFHVYFAFLWRRRRCCSTEHFTQCSDRLLFCTLDRTFLDLEKLQSYIFHSGVWKMSQSTFVWANVSL